MLNGWGQWALDTVHGLFDHKLCAEMWTVSMPCWTPDDAECEEGWHHLVRRVPGGCARTGERQKASRRFRHFGLGHAILAVLCAAVVVGSGADIARAQMSDAEKASYADALAYCRGGVERPMALRSDRQVLCLDGQIHTPNDFLLAQGLEQGGLTVVRGSGGGIDAVIALANMLLAREATVIIGDYCIGICANYLVIASLKTFVPKDALVAWTSRGPDSCIGFSEMRDPTAPYLRETPCDGAPSRDPRTEKLLDLKDKFYKWRTFSPPFVEPPESIVVRRALKRKFDATGKYPVDVFWTWHPRYHAGAIRTKVIYEAYPQSQDEVDAILARIGLQLSVIYDP